MSRVRRRAFLHLAGSLEALAATDHTTMASYTRFALLFHEVTYYPSQLAMPKARCGREDPGRS